MPRIPVPLLAVLLGSVGMAASTEPAFGRDPLVRIEPPPPLVTTASRTDMWPATRTRQASFIEVLRLWGVRFEVEPGVALQSETMPGQVTVKGGWTSPDEFSATTKFSLPRNPAGLVLSARFKLAGGPEGAVTTGEVKVGLGEAGVSAGGRWSATRGLALERKASLENALARLEIKVVEEGPDSLDLAVKFGALKVKIDPVRYMKRAREVAPALLAEAHRRAGAIGDIEVVFDAALVAAAVSNEPWLWASAVRSRLSALDRHSATGGFPRMLKEEGQSLGLSAREVAAALDAMSAMEKYEEEARRNQAEWRSEMARKPSRPPARPAFPDEPSRMAPRDVPPPPPAVSPPSRENRETSGPGRREGPRLPRAYGAGGFRW